MCSDQTPKGHPFPAKLCSPHLCKPSTQLSNTSPRAHHPLSTSHTKGDPPPRGGNTARANCCGRTVLSNVAATSNTQPLEFKFRLVKAEKKRKLSPSGAPATPQMLRGHMEPLTVPWAGRVRTSLTLKLWSSRCSILPGRMGPGCSEGIWRKRGARGRANLDGEGPLPTASGETPPG